jgi:hypothetical protein
MKKFYIYFNIIVICILLVACSSEWLDRQPSNILTDSQVFGDKSSIDGLLANYYDRLPANYLPDAFGGMADLDEAMWSGMPTSADAQRNMFINYPYSYWQGWYYDLIYDLNLAIEKVPNSSLLASDKKLYLAEFRFLRAQVYFEMVKRMGGVPLILQTYSYIPGSTDITTLQFPRVTEDAVYTFIGNEIDSIDNDLIPNNKSQTHANKYTALALKSRAMLYAASIAKYGYDGADAKTTNIVLPGKEVGIPSSRAEFFYTESLRASEEIIKDKVFSLMVNDKTSDNFYKAICNKLGNTEIIFAKDYSLDKPNGFTWQNLPYSLRESASEGSNLSPSLNLVEMYDNIDGTTTTALGDLVVNNVTPSNLHFYNTIDEPFKNKDVRLSATILTPGSMFRSKLLQIQAGQLIWNNVTGKYNKKVTNILGTRDTQGILVLGLDGPANFGYISNTGFYIHKFLDEKSGSGVSYLTGTMWWVWYRMGEVYLNAAEAAFELYGPSIASPTSGISAEGFINKIRDRAGFTTTGLFGIGGQVLTFDKLQKERECELAFEDHRLWDQKRWRIAHTTWNGTSDNPTKTSSQWIHGLYPYLVVGGPYDGKYVFERLTPTQFRMPRNFRLGNYYSEINQIWINSNPKLVRNPLQQ